MLNESILHGLRVDAAVSRLYPDYRLEGGLVSRKQEEGVTEEVTSFAIYGTRPLPYQFLHSILGELCADLHRLRARVDAMEKGVDEFWWRISYYFEGTTGDFRLRYQPGSSPSPVGILRVTASAWLE
jgi:hypothetical protein